MDWSKHLGRIYERIGVDATFTPAGGSPVSVRGFFSSPPSALQVGALEVSSTLPRFAAKSADLPAVAVDDTLVVAGTTYTVRDVQPDAVAGETVLELQG